MELQTHNDWSTSKIVLKPSLIRSKWMVISPTKHHPKACSDERRHGNSKWGRCTIFNYFLSRNLWSTLTWNEMRHMVKMKRCILCSWTSSIENRLKGTSLVFNTKNNWPLLLMSDNKNGRIVKMWWGQQGSRGLTSKLSKPRDSVCLREASIESNTDRFFFSSKITALTPATEETTIFPK